MPGSGQYDARLRGARLELLALSALDAGVVHLGHEHVIRANRVLHLEILVRLDKVTNPRVHHERQLRRGNLDVRAHAEGPADGHDGALLLGLLGVVPIHERGG